MKNRRTRAEKQSPKKKGIAGTRPAPASQRSGHSPDKGSSPKAKETAQRSANGRNSYNDRDLCAAEAGASVIGRADAIVDRHRRGWITHIPRTYPGRAIVIVGGRCEHPQTKGGKSIGREGARRLAHFLRNRLKRPVSWALPRPTYRILYEQITHGAWSQGLVTQRD